MAAAVDKGAEAALLETLAQLHQQIYDLQLSVEAVQPDAQPQLLDKLAALSQGLARLKQQAAAYDGVLVPVPLLRFIDGGSHPDDFVRLAFRAAVGDNQMAAGRVAAIGAAREALLAAAREGFPDATAAYEAAAAAKQQQQQQQE